MHELTDAEWDARGDAQSLAHAAVISDDPKRLAAAKEWAQVLALQEQDSADALKSVASA